LIIRAVGLKIRRMSAFTIDTLAVSQVLRRHGFTEEQATGVVAALREIDSSQLATKSDVDRLEAKIETTAAHQKVEILRWLVVSQITLATFLLAALKFVK
jgi:hypothetical protein